MSAHDDDVTQWVRDLKEGKQEAAAEHLVERYLERLTALARKKIGHIHAYEDEDDVALSAFKSFFRGARDGKFPRIANRESLWALLAAITVKKAISLQRRQLSQKRDVRKAIRLEAMLQADPSEEMVDSMLGEVQGLLESLEDDSLRTVAAMRMEGYSNREIAERIGRSEKTVERKLNLLRKLLSQRFDLADQKDALS